MEFPKFRRGGILVIDDDPDFGRFLTSLGDLKEVPVRHFLALRDMGSVAAIGGYDVAVLDYYLDQMNGVEVAQYVDAFFPGTPVVLISADETIKDQTEKLPSCVKDIVLKSEGAPAILAAAIRAFRDHGPESEASVAARASEPSTEL